MTQINSNFLDAIVPLSHSEPADTAWQTHGTGFLFAAQRNKGAIPFERLFLVTAKHNLQTPQGRDLQWIYIGLNRNIAPGLPEYTQNPEDARSAFFQLELIDANTFQPTWTAHDQADIAVINVNGNQFVEEGLRYHYFHGDNQTWTLPLMKNAGVSEGDSVFVLGFPSNLSELIGFFPVVRQGCIARVRDAFQYGWPSFLVSAIVSPGNSGSPVILQPSPWQVGGTIGPAESRLIGVISDYIHNLQPTADANNVQNQNIRFAQNTGLVTVWTVDLIETLINSHLERFPVLVP